MDRVLIRVGVCCVDKFELRDSTHGSCTRLQPLTKHSFLCTNWLLKTGTSGHRSILDCDGTSGLPNKSVCCMENKIR